ncbi:MAG: HAMP domain-containing histidine kinase [Chloroflexaceae bacterium]|nr:HAMP domain-containing histidine kinase [Chloroflexaceae bacterium]
MMRQVCDRDFQLLIFVTQLLNSKQEPASLISEILGCIGNRLQAVGAILFKLSTDELFVYQEWPVAAVLPAKTLGPRKEPEQPGYLVPTNNGFNEINAENTSNCEREAFSAHSTLALPIVIQGNRFGSLVLQGVLGRRLSAGDRLLLDALVELLAIAIELAEAERRSQQLEQEKEQALRENRAKSQFLSIMNHELRTPLTSILGFSRLLLEEIYGSLGDKQRQYVGAISESGEYLLDLIGDLLDISKIEAEREELFLERIAIEDICRSALAMVGEWAQQEKLELQLAIDEDLGFCLADQRRLKQILVNLLSNAIKFTDKGGLISLKVDSDQQWVFFTVKDTGVGIKEEDLPKLFQPFIQLKNPLGKKYRGTGLGLTLSRQLAQLHGGDLTVVSQEGKGSCFTLYIPAQRTDLLETTSFTLANLP